jgi:hypothetical protein
MAVIQVATGNYLGQFLGNNQSVQISPALQIFTIRQTIALTVPAASFLSTQVIIPLRAILLSAELWLPATVSATTAVKVGLGIAGTPSKYALSAALTTGVFGGLLNLATLGIPYTVAETLGIFACDNAGAAAGTIGGAGQTAQARISYLLPMPFVAE